MLPLERARGESRGGRDQRRAERDRKEESNGTRHLHVSLTEPFFPMERAAVRATAPSPPAPRALPACMRS